MLADTWPRHAAIQSGEVRRAIASHPGGSAVDRALGLLLGVLRYKEGRGLGLHTRRTGGCISRLLDRWNDHAGFSSDRAICGRPFRGGSAAIGEYQASL